MVFVFSCFYIRNIKPLASAAKQSGLSPLGSETPNTAFVATGLIDDMNDLSVILVKM